MAWPEDFKFDFISFWDIAQLYLEASPNVKVAFSPNPGG